MSAAGARSNTFIIVCLFVSVCCCDNSEVLKQPKAVKKVPKGTSDYQAAWIVAEEEEEEDEDDDDDDDEVSSALSGCV